MIQSPEEIEDTAHHEASHAAADAPIGRRFQEIGIWFDTKHQCYDGHTESHTNHRFNTGIPGFVVDLAAGPPSIPLEDALMQNFAGIVGQTMRAQERTWGQTDGAWDIEAIIAEALSDKYAHTSDSKNRNDLIEGLGREDDCDTLFRNAIIEAFDYLSQPGVWSVVRDVAQAALQTYDSGVQEGKLEWRDLEAGLRARVEALETKSMRA